MTETNMKKIQFALKIWLSNIWNRKLQEKKRVISTVEEMRP